MVIAKLGLTSTDYVCTMKTKQAELDCLTGISLDALVPLYECPSGARATALAAKWSPGQNVCWVQPFNVDGLDDAGWGDEVDNIFAALRAGGVAAVPTATLEEVAEAQAAIADAVATDARGLVLRVEAEELAVSTPQAVAADFQQFLSDYSVAEGDVDLVVDASLVRESVASRISIVESALRVLPTIGDWRSLVLLFSAFPEDMGNKMGKSMVGSFERGDREAFLALVARGLPRPATYGDFGIGLPSYPNPDAAWSPIPNIKYTDVSSWQVHRANSKLGPSPQYISLATDLAAAPYFRGSSFSAGDAYVEAVATGVGGPGNATTYLRAGMAHHIEHVLDRLATHGEP